MFAVIKELPVDRERDEKYVLSLHEHDGLPAYQYKYGDDLDALKAEVAIEWREPTEEDEASGDVILIGE